MKRMRPKRFPAPLLPAALLAAATFLLGGCEAPDNTRPSDTATHPSGNDQGPVSVPVPLPEPPPIVISDLPPEDRAPLNRPSDAPLPPEGDTLTSGQVLDRLRARLSQPTCIVGPNNTRWRHKYAGYPQHFADEIVTTLPRMLVVLDELETHKLPAEFAVIPIVESWYRQDVHSFGGAAGMWQLLAETARNNGATVNGGYDGRLSMLDSTDAAMNYLDKLQGMFHDWRLTAMAYNSGEYRLAKTMSPDELAARSAGSGIHYRRPFGLAWGTYEYVSKMRALVCMLAQPQRQEIPFDTTVPITHWVRYTVPAGIDTLDELAQRLGTDAEELKAFNRGYHGGRIGEDAPRTLLVPASTRSRWANASAPRPPAPPAPGATSPDTTSATPAHGATAATTMPASNGASMPGQPPSATSTPAGTVMMTAPAPSPDLSTRVRVNVPDSNPSKPATTSGSPASVTTTPTAPAVPSPTSAMAQPVSHPPTIPAAPAKQPDSTPPAPPQPASPVRPPAAVAIPAPPSMPATTTTAPAPPQATTQASPTHVPRTYKVEMDDSLASVARRFGVKVEDLRTWNHLTIDATLYVDEVLKLEP